MLCRHLAPQRDNYSEMFKIGDIQRYGRLVATGHSEGRNDGRSDTRDLCVCDCGALKWVRRPLLQRGKSRSCGCLRREVTTNKNRTHGGSGTRLHRTWNHMRERCSSTSYPEFHLYGGRGIRVCSEWSTSFEAFRTWAFANGYTDELTVDRIDSNGNYEPSNCRWVTPRLQARNTSRNRLLTALGEAKTMADWAEDSRCKVSYYALRSRLRYGWSVERALTESRQSRQT
jgi:hypothetical protein